MNSDTYSFAKSSLPQNVSEYTPYSSKDFNYVSDINSGVYTPSNTLVQIDATSIYNSGSFTDTSDLFLAVPIVLQAAWATDAGALVAPPAAAYSQLLCMKTNFQHLIHQIEVVCNGKTVSDTQPFISLYQHFKLASQMSQNDLKQWGTTWGFAPQGLDNERSVQFKPIYSATASQGLGLINNNPFGTAYSATDTQSVYGTVQNAGCVNTALAQRCLKLPDASATSYTTGNTFNSIFGGTSTATAGAPSAIMSASQLANEGKGYYSNVGSSMVWQDVAIIPLKYITDCLDKMGLVKKLDAVLRIYFNTGTMSVVCASAATPTSALGAVSTSTFVNSVPFSIQQVGITTPVAGGGVPATATRLCCSLSIARSSGITIPTVAGTLTMPSVSHFLPSVRLYYSVIKLEPSRALSYIEENRAKQVVYENVLFNQYTAIPASGTFSQLVQSGIKNPLGIAIIPLISSTTVVNSTGSITLGSLTGGEQYQSPYDMCPASYAPISLTNLQVALGGVNQLASTLYYSWENFMEQVGLAESLTSTDLGIGTGIISQSWWEMNRVYWVDLSRGREADKASMRNLTISFNNNSLVPITLMVFTVYLDKLVVDVETGAVRK